MSIVNLYDLIGAPAKILLKEMSRRRLRTEEDVLLVEGLEYPVEINRDSWGIPRITGRRRRDLIFAQGFVHAQDRLWQMDMLRRAASGTLAEVLGPDALETDRLTRTLGFCRLAQQDWHETTNEIRADLEAYGCGVNALIDNNPSLPIEFSILGYRPDIWKTLDSIALGRLMAWSLSNGWAAELTRARLNEKLGPELAAQLELQIPENTPLTLPGGIELGDLSLDPMLKAASGPFLSRGLEGSGRGSNGWVIAGSRTSTGLPILSNDMHLPVTTPSLWYFVRIYQHPNGDSLPPFRVSGASQPGLPYVLIGRNEQIAWGATLSMVDTEDLFLEQWHPDKEHLYRFRDQWLEAEVLEEVIKIKGRSNHLERVIVTHHGPVISSVIPSDRKSAALRSVALEPGLGFEGFSRIGQASSWEEFVQAVRAIRAPSLNLIYADVRGNIGHWVSGRVPVRADGQGELPKAGWTGDGEWIGEIPFEEMPHALNPKSGYIVTANNRIVGDDYPYYLGSSWRNGFRAARIEQLINARDRISPADCQLMQMDHYSLPGVQFVRKIEDDLQTAGVNPEYLQLILNWDGQLDVGTIGGTIIQVLLKTLSAEILNPALGLSLANELLGDGPHPVLVPVNELSSHWSSTLLRLLDRPEVLEQLSGKPWEELLSGALSLTIGEIQQRLGRNPAEWKWGRLHQIKFPHVLGALKLLDKVFSQGPFPVGGDSDTINQVAIAPGGDYSENSVSPAYRQVINLADSYDSRAMFVPGQSGHLGSQNYGSLIEPWLNGEYFSMANNDGSDNPAEGEIFRLVSNAD